MAARQQPSDDTRARIMDAAIATLKSEGITGTSARAIARTGDFNQALIFYHFGSVNDLLLAASQRASEERIERYRLRLEGITNLRELVTVAADLHGEDVDEGNITVLTQMLAGAAGAPEIGPAVLEGFAPWIAVVEDALREVVGGTQFEEVVPLDDLAYAIAAMFLGIELLTHLDVEKARDDSLFDALHQMARMVEALLQLGPITGGVVRRRISRSS